MKKNTVPSWGDLRELEEEHAKVETFLGITEEEKKQSVEIEISELEAFKNHPFKVIRNAQMEELIESISKIGVVTPIIVRKKLFGKYEVISGHRRIYAATQVGLKTIPAIIKDMSDDDAIILMVDANIQREEVLPSERAFAYKMKMDAMNRKGKSTIREGEKLKVNSAEEIGKSAGITARQVWNYISLTELEPELLDMVDNKKLQLMVAVDISRFTKEVQKWLYMFAREGYLISADIIAMIKKNPEKEFSDYNEFKNYLLKNEIDSKKDTGKISISKKELDKFFPKEYTTKQREEILLQLLKEWKERNF